MKRDPSITSKIMASVRSRDTKPELQLRRALHSLGLRFRVSPKTYPGRPDIVFSRRKLAVFVDGDFWHGNSWRARGFRSLKEQFRKWENTDFWTRKIQKNILRDRHVDYELWGRDWKVLRFWESEVISNLDGCVKRTLAALSDKSSPSGSSDRLTSIELFTGAGGIALGVARAGFDHLAVVDWDADACSTLRDNQKRLPFLAHWPVYELDVRQFDFTPYADKVSLLACGVPCQPFSLGGKHQGDRDDRNMFPEVFRAVVELKPEAVLVENVKGLLRENFRSYFEYILLQLSMPYLAPRPKEKWHEHKARLLKEEKPGRGFGELKYDVTYQLVNCAEFGVPQCRERVFIIGFRSDVGARWDKLRPTHSKDALLYAQWVDHSYWREHNLPVPDPPEEIIRRVRLLSASLLPPSEERWRTVRDALRGLPEPINLQEHPDVCNHMGNPGARSYVGHTGSPYDWPAKTLKAGDHGVPGGENTLRLKPGSVRYFTVREAARLQTFPDEYKFSGAWSECLRQLGNAVPVRMAHIVAERIREELSRIHAGRKVQGQQKLVAVAYES